MSARSDLHIAEWVNEPPTPGNGDGTKSAGPNRQQIAAWVVDLMMNPDQWARLGGSRLTSSMALSYYRRAYPKVEFTWRRGAAYARYRSKDSGR